MKTKFTRLKPLATALLFGCLLLNQVSYAEGKPFRSFNLSGEEDPKEEPAKKKKNKTTKFVSRNNDVVKVIPHIIKREMHIVARENDNKEVSFFVFDLEGTLIQQYKMKPRDHYKVSGLKKGTYIYRVFSGDEETATGKFEIR